MNNKKTEEIILALNSNSQKKKSLIPKTISIKIKCGSSETIREAYNFNFSEYKNNKLAHIKNVNIVFFKWFIEFVEKDGSVIVFQQKN